MSSHLKARAHLFDDEDFMASARDGQAALRPTLNSQIPARFQLVLRFGYLN